MSFSTAISSYIKKIMSLSPHGTHAPFSHPTHLSLPPHSIHHIPGVLLSSNKYYSSSFTFYLLFLSSNKTTPFPSLLSSPSSPFFFLTFLLESFIISWFFLSLIGFTRVRKEGKRKLIFVDFCFGWGLIAGWKN